MSGKNKSACDAIGKPLDRVDGRLKVTGKATYAAEHAIANVAYGVVVQSTIAKGRIKSIDTSLAENLPGVRAIYSCFNKPMELTKQQAKDASHLFLFQDDNVKFAGQIIALVVADSLEGARHAASLVKVAYAEKSASTNFEANIKNVIVPAEEGSKERGSVAKGLSQAAITVDETYTTPTENHNPMEPFGTIAAWEGDSLTLYDSTQAVFGTQGTVSKILGMTADKVRIVSPFVGGGFGCKLVVWPHVVLAAMAARKIKRPVKIVLARKEMFGPVGFRPKTKQRVILGAAKDGKLTAIQHDCISETATFKEYVELATPATRVLYACDNVSTSQKLVQLDIGQPIWMRAPGHTPGSFALESALDELAYKLNMDPIQLRLRNYAEKDADSGLPWSSNSLRQCYRQGAERFGWEKRNPKPRSMTDDGLLVGMGMATAVHSCWRNGATVKVILHTDGTALVQSGTQDIGTGTYTIMTQIAAEKLSLPLEKVKFELGDSNLPTAPLSGGSTTSGSVGNAVALACAAAIENLIKTAAADKASPLFGIPPQEVAHIAGRLEAKNKSESYGDVVARTKTKTLETKYESKVGKEEEHVSISTFGAQFAEVRVDPDLGIVRVKKFVGAYDGGKILNAKTARSQMLGGITFGIGMALMEQTLLDENLNRIINADLAEYHVPVHPDIGELDPFFVPTEDTHINVLGAKGIGELGITGAAAAIANAVFHATGKRIRDLPITLDNLM